MSRELDAEVAQKVMGVSLIKECSFCDGAGMLYGETCPASGCFNGKYRDDEDVPHYSTDISAAWLLVEKLIEMGPTPWEFNFIGPVDDEWNAVISINDEDGIAIDTWGTVQKTAPMAIVLTALKAME